MDYDRIVQLAAELAAELGEGFAAGIMLNQSTGQVEGVMVAKQELVSSLKPSRITNTDLN